MMRMEKEVTDENEKRMKDEEFCGLKQDGKVWLTWGVICNMG